MSKTAPNPSKIEQAATLLVARRAGQPLDALPEPLRPGTLDQAYAIQHAVTKRLGHTVAAWKVGLSSPSGIRRSGFESPIRGPVEPSMVRWGNTEFAGNTFTRPVLEVEIAFQLGRPLPPKSAPYSPAETADAAAGAFLAVEVAESRFDQPHGRDVLSIVADNANSAALVIGPALDGWRSLDPATLDAALYAGEICLGRACTGDDLCNPLWVLHWLANHLSRSGVGLREGQIVSTGALVAGVPGTPGSSYRAQIAGVGDLRVALL